MNTSILRFKPKTRWMAALAILPTAHLLFLAANQSGILVEPTTDNLAVGLVDEMKFETLEQISQAGLQKAKLAQQPWSDSYWPIYKGSLAVRFNDPEFPDSIDWKENVDFLAGRIGQGPVENLSPAEKYDLLVGDTSFSLTRRMLEEGRPYYERSKEVEPWMGYCHGWAPASFMEKRPRHKVDVLSYDGSQVIPFVPSDIKALATLLWAKGQSKTTRFIGRRCNTASPPRDRLGRALQQECLDTNAGTWHLSVVNQIGGAGRTFVMDATRDFEVWNHPVLGYSYSYFNPVTGKDTASLAEAKIARTAFSSDPRKGFRAQGSTHVVGIKMDVTYLVETFPSDRVLDSEKYDASRTIGYRYELELDSDGRIIGGEWLSEVQPDFLWTESKRSVPKTLGDQTLDSQWDRATWNAGNQEKIPSTWKAAAIQSSRVGQPLRRIVRSLIESSNL
ncbi:MAG: hypothetical protein JNL01_05085 [Bdellovibrionales bacterium]|nr:hypothetical protein [Bdellovibrionales bacterium]